MVRGFVAGVIWGGVVATAGLSVISQIAPMPAQVSSVPPATPDATPPVAPEAPDGVEADPSGAPAASEPPPEPSAAPAAASEPAAPDAPAEQPLPAAPAPDIADPTAPDAPKAPADPGLPPAPAGVADTAPGTAPAPAAQGVPLAEDAPAPVEPPPLPPLTPEEEALLAPLPEEPAPATQPATPPAVAETPPAVPEAEGQAVPDLPQVGDAPPATEEPPPSTDGATLPGTVADTMPEADPGVESGRLPRIGAEEPMPEVVVIPDDAAEVRPLAAYARPFENPDAKPLFAILLFDDGSAATDRETLAKLPFPVTFVIDPLAPNAAEAAAIYRAGMQEVVFAATGLPVGATATDVEQTFQSHAMTLPETVGVIDLPEGGFQDDRTLAAAVLPILAEQGRGLVTYDRGLNAADQIARREGLPATTIFRRLDAEGESIPTIRRYLDRAAFRAAQEGAVAVIGSTAPDTLAAILEWTVEGRAASVALAPVSALMSRP